MGLCLSGNREINMMMMMIVSDFIIVAIRKTQRKCNLSSLVCVRAK